MFKYNKITAFWAAGVAASLFGGLALAAEETIVVTAGSGDKNAVGNKDRRGDRQNAAVGIGGHPRSNAGAGRHLGFPGAAL